MMFFLYGGLLFCLGDYLGLCYQDFFSLVWIFLLLVLCSMGGFYLYSKSSDGKMYIVCGAVFVFLCGWAVGLSALRNGENDLTKYLNQDIAVSGTIIPGTVKENNDGTISLRLDCDLVRTATKTLATKGILRLSISKVTQNSGLRKLQYGRLNIQGKLAPIRGFANPGVFDTEMAAKIQGICGRMSVKAEEAQYVAADRPWYSYLTYAGTAMRQQLAAVMPEKDAAILAGMTLGGYDGIDAETVRDFSTTGIIHILSVSGSHIALLIGFVLALMSALKIRERISLYIAAVCIISYSLVCGFSPPVMRSVLMGMAMLTGRYLQRNEDRGAVLAAVVVSMICYRPMWILDLGFQLSFASTAGLIYLFPPIKTFLASRYMPNYVADALGVTIAAQLAVIPLLVHYFHQLSISSLAANLVVVPVVEFVLVLTLAGLLLIFVVKPLGVILLLLASLLLSPALRVTELIAGWPLASITVGRMPGLTALIYYIFLCSLFGFWPLCDWEERERKTIIALTCVALVLPSLTNYFVRQPFTVYFIDVGQGDAALVITPEKKTIMIDTGGMRGNYDTGQRILVPFLRYLGINKIDVLALSHGHHDHAGGAVGLAHSIKIDNILLPREEPSEDVAKLLAAVKGRSKVTKIASGQDYNLGNCHLNIIEAPEATPAQNNGNSNESSAIMRVTVEGESIVFTGDATEDEEIAAASAAIRADVLKVSHHGSKTSSTPVFLNAVQPKLAVVSVGADNRFGHPAPETLEKLHQIGSKVLRTDQLGNIKVVFDGSKCAWYSYRYQAKYF